MDSFNFAQLVLGPTHRRGHTLDLFFTHGLTVPFLVIDDLGISDHLCIRFSTTFHTVLKPQLPASYSRSLKPSTASNFMDASIASSLSRDPEVSLSALSTDELLFCFSSTCQNYSLSTSEDTNPKLNFGLTVPHSILGNYAGEQRENGKKTCYRSHMIYSEAVLLIINKLSRQQGKNTSRILFQEIPTLLEYSSTQ